MSDILERLAKAHAILEAAGFDDMPRRSSYGINNNEVRARYAGKQAAACLPPEARKGRWMAFVCGYSEFHNDPAEAVRLIEEKCARTARDVLCARRDEYARKSSDAQAALLTVHRMIGDS